MQRYNRILITPHHRTGFAMIMAIMFLVIIATLMAFMMNMTAITTKRTGHVFFTEQAQLLARSATEFALLAISGHDRTNGGVAANASCVQQINSQYAPPGGGAAIFAVQTNIRYIGLNAPPGPCFNNAYINPALAPTAPSATTSISEGMVLIDVTVQSINANLNLDQNISFHRRTLQKP